MRKQIDLLRNTNNDVTVPKGTQSARIHTALMQILESSPIPVPSTEIGTVYFQHCGHRANGNSTRKDTHPV